MFRYIFVACTLLVGGCTEVKSPPKENAPIVSSDRVADVEKILREVMPDLPSPVLEGHFSEFRVGLPPTGFDIGPTDYVTYLSARVDPKSIEEWVRRFTPANHAASYLRPPGECPWWISQEDYASLEFFEVAALSFRTGGWIGVSRSTGRIYLLSSTT